MDGGLVHAVAEHVVNPAVRPVDGELGEIGSPQAGELSVEIGKQARLHEGIIGGLDARDQISGMKGNLLGLGEVVGRVSIEGHLADQLHRRQLLRDELGGIQKIDTLETVAAVVGQHLETELPFKEHAGFDAVGQVPAMKVGVDPGGDLSLFPYQ
jgi:hypothetical protein